MSCEDRITIDHVLDCLFFLHVHVCRTERIKKVSALLSGKAAVWDSWSPEERESLIRETVMVTTVAVL